MIIFRLNCSVKPANYYHGVCVNAYSFGETVWEKEIGIEIGAFDITKVAN